FFHWDTSFFRINYDPGLSVEDNSASLHWLPTIHLGSAPAAIGLPGEHQYILSFPLWIIFTLSTIAWFAARRSRWHLVPGHCRCGYDLRGLPEPRCPECGRTA